MADQNGKSEAVNARAREKSKSVRDIRPDWPEGPGNVERRNACEADLPLFLKTYFPNAFPLDWSSDHLRVLEKMQECIINGGLMAMAMPRGGGKTTITERSAIWALLYKYRRFVSLIGATEDRGAAMLKHIKSELEQNPLLFEDFPWVCYPIRRLENNGRLRGGQIIEGVQTRMEWSAKVLTFATVPDAFSDGTQAVFGPNVSGSTISVAGITGALRGQSHTLVSGEIIRPDFAVADDPQTSESAHSPAQCAARLSIINGDMLGMAGPGQKIAAFIPCTVIRPGDTADALLNKKQSPRWQGERCRLMHSMPTNEKLWEEYANIRRANQEKESGVDEENRFYAKHRAAMDEGALAAWPQRFNADELSAIQHAMNLKIDNEAVFQAEYQNEPLQATGDEIALMTAAEIAAKVSGVPREVVPPAVEQITAFIDVHDDLLYWAVAGWAGNFTGWVLDYGAWPEQDVRQFAKRQATKTLATVSPKAGREGAIRAGLDKLSAHLLNRDWVREDGAAMRIGRCMVDTGYLPAVVDQFIRHNPNAAVLMPSRGLGITAGKKPLEEYKHKPGDRRGLNWYIAKPEGGALRTCRYDANFYKTFVHARLAVVLGDHGCLSLYGRSASEHRSLAEHLVAERPTRTFGNGRWVDEWKMLPGVSDNHWLDCIVGCAVGASELGISLEGMAVANRQRQRKHYTQADLRRRAA